MSHELIVREALTIGRGTQRRFPQHLQHFLGYPEYFFCLEMHSKRRYKIFICSVILESVRNYMGLSIFSRKF